MFNFEWLCVNDDNRVLVVFNLWGLCVSVLVIVHYTAVFSE